MSSSSYIFKESKKEKIKEFISQNQADIVLVIGVVLVALISFGLGRFSAPEEGREPVVIEKEGTGNWVGTENQGQSASVLNSADNGQSASNSIDTNNFSTGGTNNIDSQQANNARGLVVASKNSNKYHWPWCAAAKKIKLENQVWFKSEAEAQKAGFQPCADFQKMSPAGYKP
jgi:hypothetical protein